MQVQEPITEEQNSVKDSLSVAAQQKKNQSSFYSFKKAVFPTFENVEKKFGTKRPSVRRQSLQNQGGQSVQRIGHRHAPFSIKQLNEKKSDFSKQEMPQIKSLPDDNNSQSINANRLFFNRRPCKNSYNQIEGGENCQSKSRGNMQKLNEGQTPNMIHSENSFKKISPNAVELQFLKGISMSSSELFEEEQICFPMPIKRLSHPESPDFNTKMAQQNRYRYESPLRTEQNKCLNLKFGGRKIETEYFGVQEITLKADSKQTIVKSFTKSTNQTQSNCTHQKPVHSGEKELQSHQQTANGFSQWSSKKEKLSYVEHPQMAFESLQRFNTGQAPSSKKEKSLYTIKSEENLPLFIRNKTTVSKGQFQNAEKAEKKVESQTTAERAPLSPQKVRIGKSLNRQNANKTVSTEMKTQAPTDLPTNACRSRFFSPGNHRRQMSSPLINFRALKKRPTLGKSSFRIWRKLGEGKFGTVLLAQHKFTGMLVAIKQTSKRKVVEQNCLEQFIRELKIQAFLSHPNIIRNWGFFSDSTHFYSVMEVACDGQLFDLISEGKTLSEEVTSLVIDSVLNAVNHMHKLQIIHRDIKPENIVLSYGCVKICDFGWAVHQNGQLRGTFCGTPLYLSPEILNGHRYAEKVDIWAVGVMAYELTLGTSPFSIETHDDLLKIVYEEVNFSEKRTVSQHFRQFVVSALAKNPSERKSGLELSLLPFIQNYRKLNDCEDCSLSKSNF